MKHYDPSILAQFFRQHENAIGKIQRGDVIREMCEMFGFSRGTAHVKINEIREGRSVFDLASGKKKFTPRKSAEERKIIRQDMMLLAGLKYPKGEKLGVVSTELVLGQAHFRKLFQGRTYSRSQADRWFEKHGLNKKSLNRPQAAVAIKSDYSNQLALVDATVLEHYALSLEDNRTLIQIDAPKNDQHLDDLLHQKKAKKIWVYYFVEKYSAAYFVMAFAPTPTKETSIYGGENSRDLFTFLKFCFLPKKDLPFLRGKPHPYEGCPVEGGQGILYGDKGAAMTSDFMTHFLWNLGIQPQQHMPGNPRAKGSVEARIGAGKRGPDRLIRKLHIHTIDDLNFHMMSWGNYLNVKHGKYETYLEGCKNNPIRKIELQNIKDAAVMRLERVVDEWGCVSIQNTRYFTNENINGEKIKIFRQPALPGSKALAIDDRLIAVDRYGRRFEMAPQTAHSFDDYKSFAKTEGAKMFDEVRIIAHSLLQTSTFEDGLPPAIETNIRHMPPKSEAVKTHSPITPDTFNTIEETTAWVTNELTTSDLILSDDLTKTMQTEFTRALKSLGYIPGELATIFYNTIQLNKIQKIG
jgi:hypothetical protein